MKLYLASSFLAIIVKMCCSALRPMISCLRLYRNVLIQIEQESSRCVVNESSIVRGSHASAKAYVWAQISCATDTCICGCDTRLTVVNATRLFREARMVATVSSVSRGRRIDEMVVIATVMPLVVCMTYILLRYELSRLHLRAISKGPSDRSFSRTSAPP